MSEKKKILMVCLGNICRSPLAEGIMQNLVKNGKLNWIVDSAGTAGWHSGEPPHVGSIKVAKKHGIDISNQRARQITHDDLNNFDEIYVMDEENFKNVVSLTLHKKQLDKVKYLVSPSLNKNKNVPDPYFTHNFDETFEIIFDACKTIISQHYDNL